MTVLCIQCFWIFFLFLRREFGITILVLISSCLLHLVVTAYFFFLEIFGDRVSSFSLHFEAIVNAEKKKFSFQVSNGNTNGKVETGHNFTIYKSKRTKGIKFFADFPCNYHITLKQMGSPFMGHITLLLLLLLLLLENWHFTFTISLCENRM